MKRRSAEVFLLSLLVFFSLGNTFVPFGGDKLCFLLFGLVVALGGFRTASFYSRRFLVITLFSALWFLVFLMSAGKLSTKSDFYLVLFFFAVTSMVVLFIPNQRSDLSVCFIYPLTIHALVGVALLGASYTLGLNEWVEPLWGKGMPDVYAAKGFATTPQTYSTLSSLALIMLLYFGSTIRGGVKLLIGLANTLAIFTSLNRVWMLFLTLLVGGRVIRSVVTFSLAVVAVALFFIAFSNVLVFSGTISSRFEMMELLVDFFVRQNTIAMLFGDPFYEGVYFQLHGADFYYVESGPFFVALNFGLVGLLVVYGFFVAWLFYLLPHSKLLFFYSAYYLIFVQVATHEFLSISFWLYWIVSILIVRHLRSRRAKTDMAN
ncbi:hypothetical protein CQ065_10315 [Pseudomonas sp. MYb187]|uniref:hypothetical protein n=1 Tax=Pseudomonas TaxID=286 RepID=UPI000CFC5999|nr:hypothetical protein [Pseudomonas sp. MYb187]PRA66507.1 hypothetical protein CQ065_10315 [Pseudomonas sp. MYb187]